MDQVAKLDAIDLNDGTRYRSIPVYYSELILHEIYKRICWQAYDKFGMILKGFDKVFRIVNHIEPKFLSQATNFTNCK